MAGVGSSIALVVGVLSGLVGSGLGIWNRIEQRAEARRKRADRTPYFLASMTKTDPNSDWLELRLSWRTPQGIGATMQTIEVLSPRGALLRWKPPQEGSSYVVGRKIPVVWEFYSTSTPETWHPLATCEVAPNSATEIKVRVRGRETNSERTPFKSDGFAKLKDGKPPPVRRRGIRARFA